MLTPRMAEALAAIERLTAEKGFSPGYRELAVALNLRSISGVKRLVDQLADRGAIFFRPHQPHSITVAPREVCCPNCGHSFTPTRGPTP